MPLLAGAAMKRKGALTGGEGGGAASDERGCNEPSGVETRHVESKMKKEKKEKEENTKMEKEEGKTKRIKN